MSGAKHTPGPWSYDPENGGVRAHGGIIAETGTSDYTANQDDLNAQLMAAAPDLLEALKYARRFLKAEDHDTAYVDAAIAKAEGRA